jgi:hypothetical protein
MNIEFSSRFAPCDNGCKLWFLVGGKLKTPGLEIVVIDETPTLAKKVRARWKKMLLKKEHTSIGYGEILVQMLGENKVREIWPQYYFPWQHNRARRQNRREKALGTLAPVNHFHSPSVRACARRSII